jgi:hypothetical protein
MAHDEGGVVGDEGVGFGAAVAQDEMGVMDRETAVAQVDVGVIEGERVMAQRDVAFFVDDTKQFDPFVFASIPLNDGHQ